MGDYSEEELKRKYRELPFKLQEALFNSSVSEKILNIGKQFQISEENLEKLLKISGKVFMKVLPLGSLATEIKENLNLSNEVSESLAKKLELYVFSSYKVELEKTYKSDEPKSKESDELKLKMKETSPKERKLEIKEELLKKRGPDKYREQIGGTKETERARVVKEEGRIKKIF